MDEAILKYIQKPYPSRIGKALKNARFILLLGDMGTGKSTEVARIMTYLNKSHLIVSPDYHEADLELFEKCNLNVLERDRRIVPAIKQLTSGIDEGERATIFLDDTQGLSRTQIENTIGPRSYIYTRHRQTSFILCYHIPKRLPEYLLKNSKTVLIIKQLKDFNFSINKICQYLNDDSKGEKRRLGKSVIDFCRDVSDYESLYLLKDGRYYVSADVEIEDRFKPKSRETKYDTDKMTELFKVRKLTIKQVAEEMGYKYYVAYRFSKKLEAEDSSFEVTRKSKKKLIDKEHFGIRNRRCLNIIHHQDPLQLGEVTGEKADRIKQVMTIEETGDIATRAIGKAFEDILRRIWVESGSDITLVISEGRPVTKGDDRADIIIELDNPNVRLEIEVKNFNPNSTHGKLTEWDINNRVLPKFSPTARFKCLLMCGGGCNKDAKRILSDNHVFGLHLTRLQIKTMPNPAQKYRIRKRLEKEFYDNLEVMCMSNFIGLLVKT